MRGRVTWRSWLALAAGLGAYATAGYWLAGSGPVEGWLYRIGLTAAAVAPLLFVAVYTGTRQKWWRADIGTAIVLAFLAVIPTTAPLAYVFWFQGGVLKTSWLAWLAVSGPALSAIAQAGVIRVWLRWAKTGKALRDGEKP